MNRSAINRSIAEATRFFSDHCFLLPPFAHWTPEEWRRRGSEADEVRFLRLGWDVTDYSSGRFDELGTTLFTLRNGSRAGGKVYAEKIMLLRAGQATPFLYHIHKTEDIINRGGAGTGRVAVQLYNSSPSGGLEETPVRVVCDGILHKLAAGGTVVLEPGESITLTPYLYHALRAVDGHALIGEIATVNDDATDNIFLDPLRRFPEIVEDEPPLRLLCHEYPEAPR